MAATALQINVEGGRSRLDKTDNQKEHRKESVFWSVIGESIKVIIIEGAKSVLYDFLDIVKSETKVIEKNLLKRLAYYALMLVSTIFISIALVKLLQEYLSLTPGWSNLIVGLLIVLAAVIINAGNENQK